MAPIDIAYSASAGSVGLALAVVLWAWRAQTRARRREAELSQKADRTLLALADARGAAEAFEGAVIRIEDGDARLAAGSEALEACCAALGLEVDGDPDVAAAQVLQALADAAAETTQRLTALVERGESCRFAVQGKAGPVTVEGRALGGAAWLRLDAGVDARPGGRFTGLADALPAPAWITDAAGSLVWANRAWLEAVEQPSLEAARAADASFDRGSAAIAEEALSSGQRVERFRWAVIGGRRRAWRVTAEPLGEGEVLSYAIDVTEAEETRETLKRHVEAHDETLNHLADAVAIFGPSKRLSYHNTALQALFGLDPAWLDERPTHAELLDRLRQRRMIPETIDYPGWKASELDFYGSTEVAPDDVWHLPDGRTLRVVRQPHPLGGLLLLFTDITDELKLRAQYNALLQVQRATLDKLNDAVAVFGSDGQLRLRNEAFERFWALRPDQLDEAPGFEEVARLCQGLLPEPALWAELKARIADPDPESRAPVAGETRLADRRIVAWQTRPLPDGATLLAFDDVTATRELETALAQKEAALGEAERLKREFVGNVSYELRTPLTTIVGYAELLEAEGSGLPERALRHLGSIRAAAGQLARSIDDVLDMAQIDADEMSLNLGDVRVCDLVTEAGERARARIEARGATLNLDCPDNVGLIRGDQARLAQVLDQLTDNAARAVEAGGEVSLKAERAGGQVRIVVRDTGRGVPFHKQAHVFDRFVGRDRGGPGLGLALVKALTEMHGGSVSLESEPGAGAAFILSLPVATQAAGELDLAAQA
ncbi:PAS domain-containing sensor histidine kinase [Brevundimonas sp.]|uniref:PAS domain-containing sensor histidine kinase n=1 Tax=Brevundimonas sp. TaxID=1871086 RepID=UPI0025E1B585|nr:PAS domain-containing sensor histidine kinase [Brevundimonas sp.]